jgi:hypothetical protein
MNVQIKYNNREKITQKALKKTNAALLPHINTQILPCGTPVWGQRKALPE